MLKTIPRWFAYFSFMMTILTCACSSSVISQTIAQKLDTVSAEELKTVAIHFQRTGCYGNCPSYKLTLRGNGTVEYEGIRDVKTIGKKTGTINEADLKSLLGAFEKANFSTVGEDVSSEKCSCRQCTDFPSVITELTIGKTTHTVNHYLGCGCAKEELYKMEKEIDRLSAVVQWTGDVSKSGPFGTTCFGPQKRN